MHLLLPLFIGVELLRSWLGNTALGPTPTAMALGFLVLSVLLHEFGHAFACRWVGGRCNEILLWPLGGLAACSPPPGWQRRLVVHLGGPAVNLAILLMAAAALAASGYSLRVAIPNPLDPVTGFTIAGGGGWAAAVHLLAWVNSVLLAINLVPLPPLDGGAAVEAIALRRRTTAEAVILAARVGYVAAIGLAVVGLLADQLVLLVLAAVGALWCHQRCQQIRHAEAMGEAEEGSFLERLERSRQRDEAEEREAAREEASRLREEREQAERQAEVDRVLDKIRREGLDRLTAAERRVLERETRRQRDGKR